MTPYVVLNSVRLAMTVYLAVCAAKVTWPILGVYETTSPQVALRSPAEPENLPDLDVILALAPFGVTPVPVEEQPISVAVAPLDLVLHGVVSAIPAEASIAYISVARRPAERFGVGDRIAGRAQLIEVWPDHVVLREGAEARILAFPDKAGQRGAPPANSAGAANQSLPRAGASADEAIAFWRRRIDANPQSVLDQLGLDASPDGYRIRAAAHPGVRRAGFRPGDLIARVNGQSVGNVEKDRSYYDQIAASGYARVELIRDGQTIILSFPLK